MSRRERVSRGVHNSVLRTVVWDIIMLHESHPQSPPRAPRTRPSVDRCRDRFETIDRTNGRRARGGVCWPRVQLLPTLPHRQTRFCPRNEGTRFPPFARSSASSFQIPNENVHLARFTSSHVRHAWKNDGLLILFPRPPETFNFTQYYYAPPPCTQDSVAKTISERHLRRRTYLYVFCEDYCARAREKVI